MAELEYSQFVRSRHGQPVGGDAVVVQTLDEGLFVAIVDVLGHGKEAHELARQITQFLERNASPCVADVMLQLHEHLKGSRGAAAGLGFFNAETGQFAYCGVGNTVARALGAREQRLVSRDGVLGQNMRMPREEDLLLTDADTLLLYTDGVRTHFELKEYPQLLTDALEIVVKTVVERFGKPHDDAACIAVRYRA